MGNFVVSQITTRGPLINVPFDSIGSKVYYIDLARAKSEALVNNTCKQKKLNRVTLNRGRQ